MSATNDALSSMAKENVPHRVAILGAGFVGTALAKQLVVSGHSVTISNSRGPESLRREEQQTGAKAMDAEKAAIEADIVVLATPMDSILYLQPMLQSSLRSGTVLLDTSNYYPARDGRIESLDNGMPDSVWVSTTLSFPVVKAFNNIIADNMVESARARGSPERAALPVSGDDNKAVAVIMELVEEIGFDAFNAGSLADSWRQQPGQPAYCTEPSLKQLPGLLSCADRKQGARNRDKARALIEKLPPNFSPQILLRVARLSAGMDKWRPQSWLAAVQLVFAFLRTGITRARE